MGEPAVVTIWHKSMTPERWAGFGMDRQILMIGSEFNRAKNFIAAGLLAETRECYERAFELLDLCCYDPKWRGRFRELLLFREALGELYLSPSPDPEQNRLFFRTLLYWHPETAKVSID